MWADIDYSGKTCPLPGSLPHGNWSCETQEIPIHGTSFLDEDAQSYPGQLVYFWKTSRFLDFQFKINPQLFNAGWRVSLAMSLSGLLWSPVWTGMMQKSVIICQISLMKYLLLLLPSLLPNLFIEKVAPRCLKCQTPMRGSKSKVKDQGGRIQSFLFSVVTGEAMKHLTFLKPT